MAMRLGHKVLSILAALIIGYVALGSVILDRIVHTGPAGAEIKAYALGTLILAGLVVLAAIALILHRLVVRPIARLSEHLEGITRLSDLSLRLNLRRDDEIGRLGEQIDAMLARLEDSQAEVQRALDRAAEASDAKSEFLANMSHELRTPLNAVIGFAEVIEGEYLGPVGTGTYRDYATNIKDSGRHLLELINDILDLAKIESGVEALEESVVDVTEVVDFAMTLVRIRADRGAVALHRDLQTDLPPLRGDRRKLKQILINLLTNAIKFTESGGIVTVSAAWSAPEGFVVRVEDTGIGMLPEDLEKALVPFRQLDSLPVRRNEGTGLGLPLSRTLAELHGGSLELESELGVGTCVTLRLPVERTVHAAGEVGNDSREPTTARIPAA